MADKKKTELTKYRCAKAFGGRDGKTYVKGDVVELGDDEARYLNKHKAIKMYFEGDDVAPEDELPKPVRPKPLTPKKLDDSKTVVPDPAVK